MKKGLLLSLSIILSSFLSGCWSSRELNEIAVAVAVGIDRSGEDIRFSVQLINPGDIQAKTPTNSPPVTTHSIKAASVMEGLRKLTIEAPRRVYLSHLRMLVISEEIAKEGMAEILDFFARDHELRTDYYVAVAKNTSAETVLEELTTIEKIPANHMHASLDVSQTLWAPTRGVKMNELISHIASDGSNPVLTGIYVKGKPKAGNSMDSINKIAATTLLNFKGLGAFKGDRLVGWFDEGESKGYNYITGNVKSTVIVVPCSESKKTNKNNLVGVEVLRTKTNIKSTVKNGRPIINVEVEAEGNIADIACKLDVQNHKVNHWLEKKAGDDAKGKMDKAIQQAKEYRSDVFGFGEYVHRSNPKEWQKLRQHWNDTFADHTEIHTTVHLKIRRFGTIRDSIMKDIHSKE
ncbi:Ger(x)C family spore germination protein [Priestia koreensis]|uniref:Ger(x)C family spore germination protein n=1 Tax=Priestia koreensis TaxID=284581 RepID=UPI00203B56A9|nr:Ger(x)C family spore germination protein [Priestia koreensis]MCM3003071.1 Ger(x)C family spore germination protein [Priestia koreensis]